MSNTMSMKGRAGSDLELKYTPQGNPVGGFSVADTPRKFNRDTNQWEDNGPTLWQRVQVWGPEAEKAAEEVRKGSLVSVQGRVKAEEWQDPWGSAPSGAPQQQGFGSADDSTPPF